MDADEDVDDKMVDLVAASTTHDANTTDDAETRHAKYLTKQIAEKSKLLIALHRELGELENKLVDLNNANVGTKYIRFRCWRIRV